MAAKFIPRRTKLKLELYKNITFGDVGIALVGIAILFLLLFSTFQFHIYVAIAFATLWCMLFVPVSDGVKIYGAVILAFRFISFRKSYEKKYTNKAHDIKKILPYEGISLGQFISYGEYYGMVLEIDPIEFFLLDEEKQEGVVRTMTNAIHRLGMDQYMTIVKLKKPMILDQLQNYEDDKYNTLLDMTERGLYEKYEIEARSPVFEERLATIRQLNYDNKILKSHYYFVVYDKSREQLRSSIMGMISALSASATPITANILSGNELLAFLKANYDSNFDERDLDILTADEQVAWTRPNKVRFSSLNTYIDDVAYRTFTISEYPIYVPNAWAYPLFELDQCRVVVNIEPIGKFEAEKMLDRSIVEVDGKLRKAGGEGAKIELQTHRETLTDLLASLKNSSENLFNVNIHIVAEDSQKKEVRATLKQNGYRYTENFGRQVDAFISTSPSRLDKLKYYKRGMQTSTVAAMFPYISSALQDKRGFYLGYNQYPVFTDFFQRNDIRTNSNMMIIGKSGSGKSYATKTLLANLAADNTRIFILDPEDEYRPICDHLGGKIIDVGNSSDGIFNPFHIFTTLKADEGDSDDSYNAHLQFLEQFFRLILPGMSADAFEKLNSLLVKLYASKGIDETTRLEALRPEDYPIFDDLIKIIDKELKTEKDDYQHSQLQTIRVYIEKFASGGRNSNLWNGPTSIETNENFVCFNFRTLTNNRNDIITNAQMLLVFKYLDNEISKNKDFNDKYFPEMPGEDRDENEFRRIIVAVDEAHVFINPKYPIALDFMANMAKRIRKYHGMQIIITQNIHDFVGSEEIERQSTAVINACQYSMIFSLAPNDMTELITLYKNAGGINKEEQDQIVTAPRGQCFLITGPMNRSIVRIEALPTVQYLFKRDDE